MLSLKSLDKVIEKAEVYHVEYITEDDHTYLYTFTRKAQLIRWLHGLIKNLHENGFVTTEFQTETWGGEGWHEIRGYRGNMPPEFVEITYDYQ